jgi:hypothetical protein
MHPYIVILLLAVAFLLTTEAMMRSISAKPERESGNLKGN